ncbi:DNA polymerase III subunit chi [Maritimibacter sp. DP1N21-5]|uniref:DNA polymerase III subunit chi n=1 Tax=Maritimibacter sp. DP1N21-5 TaxID=2836867 RepID=UPI001C48BAD8|nr:DNA polymerase III subunit chi [Maritimibacter sp. DP1N21-5]
MGEAYFYHLTATPIEATLPTLLSRALGAGWRVVVRGTDEGRLRWLDDRLWEGEGFLPHGTSSAPHAADQPVLLTTEEVAVAPNGARCLVSIDGADLAASDITASERAMILFDGNDDRATERAREQWRSLTGAGVKAKYWSQETGAWALKAESK